MNCVNTGEISLLSPARNPHLSRIMSPMSRNVYCHAPVGELVPEVEPVLLYEGLVALDGAVVWVDDELGQGAGLTGPVPAVGAVDHRADAAGQGLGDEEAGLQHRLDVLEPLALVYALEEVLHGVDL